jgi:hypothetical protein
VTDAAAQDRRRRARWWVLAAALGVVGVACVGAAVLPARGGGADRVAAPRPTAASTWRPPQQVAQRPLITANPPVRAVPRVPPVRLSVPANGVSQRLLRLGLHHDHTVEVPAPSDAAYPGWFRLGPTPGQVGSSVILGHVDSLQGPAVFYRLRFLRPGNHVDVRLRNGAVAHFAVQRVATYPNAAFPARKVYGSPGYAALNLVTCGGAYERAHGGYQSNVVVYTRLVGTSRS